MVPRAHWKGFLKLSLVSCPVALYPAVAASERISFRQVNKQTGNRLRQQLVDVVTGEPVQAHNKGRGYEVGENQFLLVSDDELEAAEQEGRSSPYSSVPAKTGVEHDKRTDGQWNSRAHVTLQPRGQGRSKLLCRNSRTETA